MQKTQIRNIRRQRQSGFTLIELLIVVAIIGILAAVGIPQYQNYIDRSNASAALSEASSFRTPVEAALLDNDDPSDDITTPTSVTITGDGSAAVTVASAKDNGTVTLTRSDAGDWTCAHTFANATLDNCTGP